MKKYLFVTEHNPFGSGYGAQQRTNLLFNALQQLGHVHLFCITKDPPPEFAQSANFTIEYFGKHLENVKTIRWRNKLFNFGNPQCIFPVNSEYQQIISSLCRKIKFDSIIVRYLQTAFTCGLYFHDNMVIDVDDLPHQYHMSMSMASKTALKSRVFHLFSALHTGWYGNRLIKRSRIAFYSNPLQAKSANSIYLPNVPFLDEKLKTAYSLGKENKVLFVGTLHYEPNSNGIEQFICQSWPTIKANIPDAKLEIVGFLGDPIRQKAWEEVPGVIVKGFVEDLKTCYLESRVVIVPIREGAGTHIKILEAMQFDKACVITPFAARGYKDLLKHQQNVLFASHDKAFAEAVIRLLKDATFSQNLGKSAGDTIRGRFTREVFNQIVKNALA